MLLSLRLGNIVCEMLASGESMKLAEGLPRGHALGKCCLTASAPACFVYCMSVQNLLNVSRGKASGVACMCSVWNLRASGYRCDVQGQGT